MYYVHKDANEAGAMSSPQSTPFRDALVLPEDFLGLYVECAGFVTVTHEDGVITSVTPNTEAHEAWKAAHAAETTQAAGEKDEPVTWAALDAAYNEGRDTAYDE